MRREREERAKRERAQREREQREKAEKRKKKEEKIFKIENTFVPSVPYYSIILSDKEKSPNIILYNPRIVRSFTCGRRPRKIETMKYPNH